MVAAAAQGFAQSHTQAHIQHAQQSPSRIQLSNQSLTVPSVTLPGVETPVRSLRLPLINIYHYSLIP